MDFQCLYTILNALPMFGQYLTIYVGLDSLSVGAIMELLLLLLLLFFDFCIGEAFLMENCIDFSCLMITTLEYPFVLEEHYG